MYSRAAVIFDVDGVLVDSYRAHFRSWQLLAAEHSREYTEEQFAAGFGRTSREVITEQWNDQDLTEQQIRELDSRKETLYRNLIASNFPEMEGAADLVRALHESEILLAVGSSGPEQNVRLVLEKLGIASLISAVVTADDVQRGKPDPQVFQLAAERLAVSAANCVVVEDAPTGIQAAHAAGMKVVAVASTGRTTDELKTADIVVKSLRSLSGEHIRKLIAEVGES